MQITSKHWTKDLIELQTKSFPAFSPLTSVGSLTHCSDNELTGISDIKWDSLNEVHS